MMTTLQRNILLNPGPVTTTETVKEALKVPDICHREQEFSDLIASIRQDLLTVVQAKEHFTSILFAASGTGAVEACISSVIPQNEKIAIINNGAYGQRMLDIAKRYGIQTVELKYSYQQALPLAEIENVLKADQNIQYVGLVHHETSSGILNPLRKIGDICQRLQRRFLVDAMSSYAGSIIDMEADHIDFLVSSSNKCLQGMPGIAFVIAHLDRLLETEGNARSFYLDLHQQYRSLQRTQQLPFTPPVQVAYALKQALNELLAETVAARIQRYQNLYKYMIQGLEKLNFKCMTPKQFQSQLLAIMQFPNDAMKYDFDIFHDDLYRKGYVIYPKMLPIENTFRVACMGDLTINDIEQFLLVTQLHLSHIRNAVCQSKV